MSNVQLIHFKIKICPAANKTVWKNEQQEAGREENGSFSLLLMLALAYRHLFSKIETRLLLPFKPAHSRAVWPYLEETWAAPRERSLSGKVSYWP